MTNESQAEKIREVYEYFVTHKTTEGFVGEEFSDETIPVQTGEEDIKKTEPRFNKIEGIISAKELLNSELPDTIFVINNLLPVGLTFLAGRPKIGKSWLALQMAYAVGIGGEFLGEKVEQRSVIYLAYEDAAPRLKKRLQCQGMTDKIPNIDFLPSDIAHEKFDNLNAKNGNKLKILTAEYDLIIVDTLAQAIHLDYNDNNELTKAIRPLQEMAQENETAILFVDHHRKPKMRGVDIIDDLLGGTAKAAIADTVWGLYEENKAFYLEIVSREIEEKKMQVSFDKESCTWSLDDSQPQTRLGNLQELALSAVMALREATNPQIIQFLTEITQKIPDRSNLYKSIQSLIEKGKLAEKDGNIYYIPKQ